MMKNMLIFLLALQATISSGQEIDRITTNEEGTGQTIEIHFTKGVAHNHPLMAIWVEDTSGQYLQSLYVAESVATGIFNYGDKSSGQWTKGELVRPAALPYWAHKRGIQSEEGHFMPTPRNPVSDAYTGPTPKSDFILVSTLDNLQHGIFNVLFEINQPWDWNEYWSNARFPGDYEYSTSSQPAVIYKATIDPANTNVKIHLEAIGHSHYSGKDGNLYEDISTLTTALKIAEMISVMIVE